MERGLAWAALCWASAAGAQVPVAPAAEPTLEETLIAFGELNTRMTVPVTIGAGGPWNFIVDTGAERTVVSRELAGSLKLAAGPSVRVLAMTGPEWVPSYLVPQLQVGAVAARGILSPALGARDMGAVGMVGIDTLQAHSVVIDFDKQRMSVKPSKRKRRGSFGDDVVITAKSLYGQLIVTDARWRGKRIAVVIDTGTPISIGNGALYRMMSNAKGAGSVSLTSATGETLSAQAITVGGIQIGGIGFTEVSMAIADAAPFARFGLTDTPALLMGMDLLRLFRQVNIDFANRQISFTLPRGVRTEGVGIRGV